MYEFQNIKEERDFAIIYAGMLEEYFRETAKLAYNSFVEANAHRPLFKELQKKVGKYEEEHPLFQYFLKSIEDDIL